MKPVKHLDQDVLVLNSFPIASAAQGSGGDTEPPLMAIPDLSQLPNPGARATNYHYIRDVQIIAQSTVNGAATNNVTFNVNLWRGGANIATLATITLGNGTNLTAKTAKQLLVSMVSANQLQPGDVITFARVSNGTGLATPALTVQLDIQPVHV